MAFQNLRNGSTVYILYKTNEPKLEIGQVASLFHEQQTAKEIIDEMMLEFIK